MKYYKDGCVLLIFVLMATVAVITTDSTKVLAGGQNSEGTIANLLRMTERYNESQIIYFLSLERDVSIDWGTARVQVGTRLRVSPDLLKVAAIQYDTEGCTTVIVLYDYGEAKR